MRPVRSRVAKLEQKLKEIKRLCLARLLDTKDLGGFVFETTLVALKVQLSRE